MKKIEIVKKVLEVAVSIGVGAVVGNLVKSTTPSDVGKINKFFIAVGSMVLTGVLTDASTKYAEATFTKTVDEIKKGVVEDTTEAV